MISIRVRVSKHVPKDELDKRLKILGELIINEIKRIIKQYDLISRVGGGAYLQGWFVTVSGNKLTIENTQEYAEFLEYGTYAFGRAYGDDTFPEPPVKKRDLPLELRKNFPKGMAPFAPVRRVFYNQELMRRLVSQAFA